MRDITRREFCSSISVAGIEMTQLLPQGLLLIRDQGLARTLDLNACITGELYAYSPSNDYKGAYLCDTLELPYRNELSEISSIRPGRYILELREDGDRGWRLQLQGTTQLAIQIHSGNKINQTRGCILVGYGRANQPCYMGESQKALGAIREKYDFFKPRSSEYVLVVR